MHGISHSRAQPLFFKTTSIAGSPTFESMYSISRSSLAFGFLAAWHVFSLYHRRCAISHSQPRFSQSVYKGSNPLPNLFAPIYSQPPRRSETFQVRGRSPSGDQTYSKARITSSASNCCGKLWKKRMWHQRSTLPFVFCVCCLLTDTSYCQ